MTSKPGDPEEDREAEEDGRKGEGARDGHPRPDRGNGEGEAEEEVGEGGDALGVRVAEDDHEGDGREDQAEAVQLRGGENEEGGRAGAEEGGGGGRDHPGRDLPARGPRVLRVDSAVDDPVERHRGRAGAHHGDEDPEERPPVRDPTCGQDRCQERERQGEDGVGEDDEGEKVPRGRHRPASVSETGGRPPVPGVKSCIVFNNTRFHAWHRGRGSGDGGIGFGKGRASGEGRGSRGCRVCDGRTLPPKKEGGGCTGPRNRPVRRSESPFGGVRGSGPLGLTRICLQIAGQAMLFGSRRAQRMVETGIRPRASRD